MIKARVIQSFYYAKGKELYVDEDRFNELKELELVEEVKGIKKAIVKNTRIEKATNDKTRVLSD